MKKKYKVLFIDPWGTNETAQYTNGICSALFDYVDLKLVANYYYEIKEKYNVQSFFFKYSEKMQSKSIRRVLRGLEYIIAWEKIICDVKREAYDCVHINWLLLYKVDIKYLRKLKKMDIKIIYTAHNVIPHVNGKKYIEELRMIYSLVDKIILHGKHISEEFIQYFPEYKEKIYIQKHGCNIGKNKNFCITEIKKEIFQLVNQYSIICLYIGNVFYNKGVDRLLHIWEKNEQLKDCLLIIAGKETELDEKYKKLKSRVKEQQNIFILDYFVSENTANYLLTNTDIVILPYRHASMSGVVFTAADFGKTVIATNVGALPEYLSNVTGAFLVENRSDAIEKCLLDIKGKYTREQLKEMGNKYRDEMYSLCSWEVIAKDLFENCYKVLWE